MPQFGSTQLHVSAVVCCMCWTYTSKVTGTVPVSGTQNLGGELGSCAMGLSQVKK